MTDREYAAYLAQQDTAAGWLREVRRTEGWTHYDQALAARITEETELMLQGVVEKFEYRKGLIEGLRIARALPDHVIDHAEAAHAREK